jgi:hypothetical protein
MNPINWESWRCRCSSISKILSNSKENPPITDLQLKELEELDKKPNRTDKQGIRLAELVQKRENSKNVVLSDTAVGYLLEAFAWETEKMCSVTKEMDVEYFERGRKTEPESIELLSFVDNTPYVKNEYRFENDFLSGIPDVLGFYEPEDQRIAPKSIKDIKSTQDYPTFLYKIHKGLDAGNAEQLQGYGDILECGDLGVAFTLPTMPESIRNGYKMKLAYKMDEVTTESPRFLKAWAELEHSMIFKHMPPQKRVYKIPVQQFTTNEQSALYDRVKHCREWLFNFDQKYKTLNT